MGWYGGILLFVDFDFLKYFLGTEEMWCGFELLLLIVHFKWGGMGVFHYL